MFLEPGPKEDPEGPAPAGAGRVPIGCRSKDAETNANENPALLTEDNSTICTRDLESMCGTESVPETSSQDPTCSYDPGAAGADQAKKKICGGNKKTFVPDRNLLNPELHPGCIRPGAEGMIAGTKGTIPLPGVLDSRDFRKVDRVLFGKCDVCSIDPIAHWDEGTLNGFVHGMFWAAGEGGEVNS